MQGMKKGLRAKHALWPWEGILWVCLFSMVVTFAMLCISPLTLSQLADLTRRTSFMMPVLNWAPVLLCMLALFFLTGSTVGSISIAGYVFIMMAVVNRVKLEIRGDPLLHWDFALAGEVMGVAKGFSRTLIVGVVLASLLFLVAALCTGRLFPTRRTRWPLRIACLVGCALAMLGLNQTVYSDKALEAGLPTIGSFYNMADVHNSKGNLYELIYHWNTSKSQTPDGYDLAETRAFVADYAQGHEVPADIPTRPHIVMVMGEAFSALSDSPVLDFSDTADPLATFHALGAEGIEGRLVVPSRGGGTADTEFDVLTARPSRLLRSAPYAYRMVAEPVEALPSLLASAGYDTMALHPGFRWFYNRQNVYPNLGFAQSVFEDEFPRDAYLDSFISEVATFDRLLEMLQGQRAENPESPLFAFCLTIQNHGLYHNRYLPEGTYNFETTADMTDEERNILSNYFAGVLDGDRELRRLTEYLNSLDEPAILVYFGDHLPALEQNLYDLLLPESGADEPSLWDETRLYQVPFLIWPNDAAKAQGLLDVPEDQSGLLFSSNYLGAYLMEQLGMDGLSPYWQFTNTLRGAFPIIMETQAFAADGTPSEQTDAEARALLTRYRHWVHYRTYEEK